MSICSCSLAMTKACDNCPNNTNKFNEMKRNGELFYIEIPQKIDQITRINETLLDLYTDKTK